MKQLVNICIFLLIALASMAQQPQFRLHMQGGKTELMGNGDDYTTIVITARDDEGEIITSMNGKVSLRCSSGFVDDFELNMVNGVALTKYTAPIFGQPVKAAQRMVYFMVKFIRKFLSGFNGSTDVEANQKLAGKIALETFKEGINPLTLVPQKDNDNFAYFVCEMNGVKGKAKIQIVKATEGGNSSILPGYYTGYDVTGSAPFEIMLGSGGQGQMTQNGADPVTILFTNEKSAEINSAMQKMMGGGEWMNAYVGASERDMQYMEGYDIRKNGLPSIYLPMPDNGIFTYIPPILFEYQGRPKENSSVSSSASSGNQPEPEKKENVYVSFFRNEVIGDGRSQAVATFHYEDISKVPVSGINIRWNVPKELKIISAQTTTDASGNAKIVVQVPVVKATSEERGEYWKQIVNNTVSSRLQAYYSTPKKPNESVFADLTIFKTIEKNIYILKAGFETTPVKILLPQLEQYQLEGNIFALIEMINSPAIPEKKMVNDAVVMIERQNFDTELFTRKYELYFKKERKNFISGMDVKRGGFIGVSDANGNFKVIVGGNSERKLKMEAMQAKLSDLTGRRKGELGKTLSLFKDPEFVNKIIAGLFGIDKDLCAQKSDKAVMTEEKLHIIGLLMVNANTGDKLIKDTGDELMGHGWELMKTLAEYANSKWKITDKLYKKMKLDKVSDKLGEYGKKIKKSTGLDNIDLIADSLTKLGLHYDNAFWKAAMAKDDYKYGTKKIIQYFLAETVLPEGARNADKAKASVAYYKLMGDYGGQLSGIIWEKLSESISEALATYVVPAGVKKEYDKASKYVEETTKSVTDYAPDKIKEAIQEAYYSSMKEQILRFFSQTPENVHLVYTDLQPALRDRSTDLRAYYSSVAAWRYSAEMLKAYVDLGIDLIVKSIVIIVDAYSGNWTSIPGHMKKLDEGKGAIGTAFTSGGFALEIYRLNNLWAEVVSSFVYANKCIEQGSVKIALAPDNSWSVFPSAYASVPGKIVPVSLSVPDAGKLKYTGNGLPIEGLNAVFANSAQLENWLEDNMPVISRLAFTKPEEAAALFEKASDYRAQSEQLAILSIAVAADPRNSGLANEFNKTASETVVSGKELKEATGSAAVALNELNSSPQVNKIEGTNPVVAYFSSQTLIYAGAGVLMVVIVILIFIRKRKRRSTLQVPVQAKPTPVPVPNPVPQQLNKQSVAANQQPNASTPKFCPQCGTSFKSGAKFCGKCGYKAV